MVFIGDSLTRYQFISLAHFLHRGSWQDERGLPSLTNEKQHKSPRWPNYYFESSLRLGCAHLCDCVRTFDVDRNATHLHEHIYHYDLDQDLLMIFHFFAPTLNMTFYLPDHPTRQQLLLQCLYINESLEAMKFMAEPHEVHRYYSPSHLTQFIATEVSPSQPSALFFNQGFWQAESFRDPDNLAHLAAALRAASPLSFWKAITEQIDTEAVDSDLFLQHLQSLGLGLYDAYAVTKNLKRLIGVRLYFDKRRHFISSFVYRVANIVLLELLRIAFSGDQNSTFPLVGRLPAKPQ
ncbi:hypothetical protein EON65_04055 [archaeon]|nr:MAG: hypothetical protein EON65_04055 [archaeon]